MDICRVKFCSVPVVHLHMCPDNVPTSTANRCLDVASGSARQYFVDIGKSVILDMLEEDGQGHLDVRAQFVIRRSNFLLPVQECAFTHALWQVLHIVLGKRWLVR